MVGFKKIEKFQKVGLQYFYLFCFRIYLFFPLSQLEVQSILVIKGIPLHKTASWATIASGKPVGIFQCKRTASKTSCYIYNCLWWEVAFLWPTKCRLEQTLRHTWKQFEGCWALLLKDRTIPPRLPARQSGNEWHWTRELGGRGGRQIIGVEKGGFTEAFSRRHNSSLIAHRLCSLA